MKTQKRPTVIILIVLILMCIKFTGCSNNKFYDYYHEFKVSYLKIANVVDAGDPIGSLKNLNNDSILLEIEKMRSLLKTMKDLASSKNQKGLYGNAVEYLRVIDIILPYMNKDLTDFSWDKYGPILSEFSLIEMNRDNLIKEKDYGQN